MDYPEEWRGFVNEWNNDNDYVMAHTSGSTGEPKEIRLLKSDMMSSACATNNRFGITQDSRLLCPLSPNYIAGKMMMVRAIAADCTLIAEHPSNEPLADDYGTIDLMAVVPSQCASLLNNDIAASSLKNLIIGGAPLPANLEKELVEMPWRSYATYGMTETCSHVALRKLGTSVYEAMPGILFSQDERDCLVIESDLFSFKRLVTNDVVDLLDNRAFRWLGRHDNVINSGGVKFHPEQLEKLLEGKFPFPFYFMGVPHEKWGQSVAMAIEAPADSDAESIIIEATAICRACLPRYAFPTKIHIVDALPRTANGKLQRKESMLK